MQGFNFKLIYTKKLNDDEQLALWNEFIEKFAEQNGLTYGGGHDSFELSGFLECSHAEKSSSELVEELNRFCLENEHCKSCEVYGDHVP